MSSNKLTRFIDSLEVAPPLSPAIITVDRTAITPKGRIKPGRGLPNLHWSITYKDGKFHAEIDGWKRVVADRQQLVDLATDVATSYLDEDDGDEDDGD